MLSAERAVPVAGILALVLFQSLEVRAVALTDVLAFGDAASESAHGFVAEWNDCVTGAVKFAARRLLPPETNHWAGGRVSFAMQVVPDATNYIAAGRGIFTRSATVPISSR